MSDLNGNLNALELEQFWPDEPALWFAQTEAQFWYHNVKDDLSKFNCVIAQLDKHYLTVVKDVVLSPPASNKYETLKSKLFKRLKESKIEYVKQLLISEDIGDMKPSQFLDHLKDLAGPDIGDEYIKSVWSSRLPSKVQWVSSFLTSSSLEKIAQLADLAINSPTMTVPAQSNTNNTKVVDTKDVGTRELTKRLEELTKRVEALSLKVDNETRPMSTNSSRQGGDISSKMASTLNLFCQSSTYKKLYTQPLVICWYHEQFGWDALKCDQPCNFKTTLAYLR